MVAELFLSAFLEVMFDRFTPHARDLWNLARSEGLEEKLEMLVNLFRRLEAVLADAEEKQLTERAVKLWLDELKDLAYDAEDVIDEFSTEALRLKVIAKQQEATKSKFLKLVPSRFTPAAAKFNIEMGSKIDAITRRLEEISKQRGQLSLVENCGGSNYTCRQPTQTTSMPIEPVVYGREKDRENIINQLLNDNQNCHVIPIVAMGGAGKTTLAQHVYGDPAVVQAFKSKARVCVSIDFDVIRIMKAILVDLTSQSCELMELQPIQARLKEALNGKRFLIVLHDIWDHTFIYEKWLSIESLLRLGAAGSKIIVTTRQKEIAETMGSVDPYILKLLSADDCWLLFKTHAFKKRGVSVHPNLQFIREKVVERCNGLPLAARTLGGLLCSKQSESWEEILNSKTWNVPEVRSGVLPVLRLSYYYLPPQLKRCFAYCAIFPQDYEFMEEELVLLWIAEGLIQQTEGSKPLIQEGREYFRELVSRSLFQASRDHGSKFIMHDLVHEIAKQVGGNIYLWLDDGKEVNEKQEGIKKVRHCSYVRHFNDISKRFEVLRKAECLRTFRASPPQRIEYDDYYNSNISNNVSGELSRLTKLRVLSFSGYDIYELPDSIGNLKHLRCLDLSSTKIRCLPKSTYSLYNLQILSLRDCKELRELPLKMENFISLCYLDITNADRLREMPIGLKELKSLQVLSNFIVGKGHGCGLKELMNFKDLSGKICLSNLENVVDAREATEASLNEKKSLEVLVLKWGSGLGDSGNVETERCVLDKLQPNQNIKEITIIWYGGNAFPSWLGNPLFSSMKILKLENCKRCEFLPPLGQLPSLKTLEIKGMHGVTNVGVEFYGSTHSKAFPSLESLSFEDMSEWENWSGFDVYEQVEGLSYLSTLSLKDCPKLSGSFPNRLPSLKKLVVHRCEMLNVVISNFPKLQELDIDGCAKLINRSMPCTIQYLTILPVTFCSLIGLRKLRIERCSSLRSLPSALFLLPVLERITIKLLHNLQILIDEVKECVKMESSPSTIEKKLYVSYCPSLACASITGTLPALLTYLSIKKCSKFEFVAKTLLSSLTHLGIESCPRLEFVTETFQENTKLESIKISKCENFERLPEGIKLLSHLKDIYIDECPNFLSFPRVGFPNNMLKKLFIEKCKKLEALPNGISSLTSLEIKNCESIKFVPQEGFFTNLTTLYLEGCPDMGEIPMNPPIALAHFSSCPKLISLPNLAINLTNLNILHCPEIISLPNLPITLAHLAISYCPKLISLPNLPINLTNLNTLHCPEITSLPNLPTTLTHLATSYCPKLISLPNLPINLTKLHISNCPEITSLPNLPTSLARLEIWSCGKLTALPNLSTTSLIYLYIINLSQITSLPNLPICLTRLLIMCCPRLKSLPSNCFQNLTSLYILLIGGCRKIKSLPKEGLPPSLTNLEINDCPLLRKRCKRDKGKDWHKIAGIPSVTIDEKCIYDPESNDKYP